MPEKLTLERQYRIGDATYGPGDVWVDEPAHARLLRRVVDSEERAEAARVQAPQSEPARVPVSAPASVPIAKPHKRPARMRK